MEEIKVINRIGEFHEDEIIEISKGDVFQYSHFFNCEFVGMVPVAFEDCVFVFNKSPILFVPCQGATFRRCLLELRE